MTEVPDKCPCCGLVLLHSAIFDAAAMRAQHGPIIGIDKDADQTANAGYIGISSLWLYDVAPDLYHCPRCGKDPIAAAQRSL